MAWILLRPSNYKQVAPLVRTGGSRHTGLAALPHRNIHSHINCFYFFKRSIDYLKDQFIDTIRISALLEQQIFQLYKTLKKKASIVAIHINMKCFFFHTMHLRFSTFIICIDEKQLKCGILLIKNKRTNF